MDFLKDLWGFLKQRKKFWLLPMTVILLVFGVVMVFAAGSAIELNKDTVFLATGAAGSIVSAITSDLATASSGALYLFLVLDCPNKA